MINIMPLIIKTGNGHLVIPVKGINGLYVGFSGSIVGGSIGPLNTLGLALTSYLITPSIILGTLIKKDSTLWSLFPSNLYTKYKPGSKPVNTHTPDSFVFPVAV